MDIKKLYEQATIRGIETPGIMTLSWKALGRSSEPFVSGPVKLEIPKQSDFSYLYGAGRTFASITANWHKDGGDVTRGRLLVCTQNHTGFFVPEEVQQ